MRVASQLVDCAGLFQSDVRVEKGSKAVNGKSIMDLVTLAAEQGDELTFVAEGSDAEQLIDALATIVTGGEQ